MIDALAHFSRVVRLAAELRPSVVFCDVGGNRDGATVTLLLARMQSELKVELTVVKNRALHRAALRHAARRRDRECMQKQLPLEASALVTNSLPDAEIFWATQLARAVLRDHNLGMPIDDCEELNIACDSEQERRLCFEFANTGRCTRRRCTFRHLPHEHPDAVADLARRKAQAESIGSTQG
uniref:C3H1-type domain-containing protein n=1 Tax=Chrysotila carterae TaxID=13221 RepID=A0A6S9UJ46_CHRCT|mmetsp:Transcript_58258/g.126526  ORF Transcript_58258/g.126526 Transcript_58258/m.126526 type:complete len:182 (+) Transcript_58258:1148-1693(+)